MKAMTLPYRLAFELPIWLTASESLTARLLQISSSTSGYSHPQALWHEGYAVIGFQRSNGAADCKQALHPFDVIKLVKWEMVKATASSYEIFQIFNMRSPLWHW